MINWNQFTVDNQAITDLRELLFLTVFNDPDIDLVVSNETGVYDGKKLGYIDSLGDVGLNESGCSPTYGNINITGIEKEWKLGDWRIAKHICYSELENTIAKYQLNAGTEKAYLQDTPYWDQILIPLLQRAIKEMFWRIVWFGDTAADNVDIQNGVNAGGNLTVGIDKKLFTMCDGLWKRLFTICAGNAGQHTTIAANSEASYALQKSALRTSGVAIGIVDELLSDADSRIFDKDDAVIMMTSSLFKALRRDIVDRYGKTTMPFENVATGITLSEYDGRKVLALDIWDRMIKKYEDNGTVLNNPHRALVASPSNLFVGTEATDKIAHLNVSFNDETLYNNIFAMSKIGTLIGEDALVRVAY